MAARLILQLGPQAGNHLVPAHIHSSDPNELSHRFVTNDTTINIVLLKLLLLSSSAEHTSCRRV